MKQSATSGSRIRVLVAISASVLMAGIGVACSSSHGEHGATAKPAPVATAAAQASAQAGAKAASEADASEKAAAALAATAFAETAARSRFIPEVLPLPSDPDEYEPLARYTLMELPMDNRLTAAKAALGRQLYHDTRLSGDGKLSCYSCHVCEKGLTDGRALGKGAFDKPLTRSSPTLWNIGYHHEWYWDGRAKTLEAQALAAWKGANMGADADAVCTTLNATPGYAAQFLAVFGGPATPDGVSKALASHMRTIIGGHTPWDRAQAGDMAATSDAAKRGWDIFQKSNCTSCHAGMLFTDLQYHNVGIGMTAATPDVGRFKVTNIESDMGAFKTPTLRDISESAPYFHDGSVATLEEAVKLMVGGGIDNPHISRDKLKPVKLSPEQFADLIEFLKALDEPCDMPAPPLPPAP